jgi:hypothetical protein
VELFNLERRVLIKPAAKADIVYTMDGHNGEIIGAKPYMVEGPRHPTNQSAP